MKKFNKNLTVALVAMFVVSLALLAFGFTRSIATYAATAVNLNTADSFAILAGSGISDPASGSVIVGNVGLYPTGGTAITTVSCAGVTGTIYDKDSGYPGGGSCHVQDEALLTQAKADLVTAYNTARDQATTTVIAGGALANQELTPGVYGADSSLGLTGLITLNGGGDPNAVFIFKAGSTLTTAGASEVRLTNGTQACNVFWQVGSSATLGSGSTFNGTILAMASITAPGSGSTVLGRLLARDAAVVLNNTDVTKPTCVAAAPAVGSRSSTINVVKTVINDNGRTKTVANFPLFVNGVSVVSGVTNRFPSNLTYFVTETKDPNYTQAFSGDCDSNGQINLIPGDNRVCIITNNDIAPAVVATSTPPIPPLIDVVKVPSPLALPNGPGAVTYTYTLRNIGTVPVTDITMVGDTCSPIILASGDTNNDAKLDVNETWVHTCSTTLSATHTNTVTATGWANGISAVDIASATVVVGVPIVPPLIHVTKIPSVFTLPAPGGAVTYTYTVTNPGTEPLSNVSITDNKCTGLPGRVSGHPGDLNKNDLLESNETWIFTCQTKLTQTTTNTGTASGEANGLIARDFAIATVVVAAAVPAATVPKLPNTGVASMESVLIWPIAAASIFAVLFLFYIVRKKQTV